jgi:hypothetical protein
MHVRGHVDSQSDSGLVFDCAHANGHFPGHRYSRCQHRTTDKIGLPFSGINLSYSNSARICNSGATTWKLSENGVLKNEAIEQTHARQPIAN